jgi:putative cardiolipin synthase
MNSLYIWFVIFSGSVLTACASLPSDYQTKPSYSNYDTQQTALGKKAAEYISNNPEESVIYVMNEGTDAFFARLSLLESAERTIDVQYYIWHDDLIGKLLFNGIVKAAERGVRVRMLIDDFNLTDSNEAILYAIDQHKSIEVRLYNPFATRGFKTADFITSGSRINRRMHNKSFTVDGQFTIVGGRNIGDEYFSANEESNYKDIDVMSIGPLVEKIGKQFDIYWNSKEVYPVKAFEHDTATVKDLERVKKELKLFSKQQKNSKYAFDVEDSFIYQQIMDSSNHKTKARLFKGKVDVLYDDPQKTLNKSEKEVVYLKTLLIPYIEKSTKSFELISPYFVPGEEGSKVLVNLVKKGIKVRVLTNSLSSTDGIMAQSGYARHRIELLEGGVEIYELKTRYKIKASRALRRGAKAKIGLHGKTYIFDRKQVFIGSFNFDQRSANINTEVGVIYHIPELAELISSTVFDINIATAAYKLELITQIDHDDDFDYEFKIPVWIETVDGKEIRHTKDPKTSGWRRFNEDVFSVLPIESEL